MLAVRLLVALVFCTIPVTVSAQQWAEAYRAGQYHAASDFLHAIVTDIETQLLSVDPAPARHLAVLYAQGLGVEKDPVAACALAMISDTAAYLAGTQGFGDSAHAGGGGSENSSFADEHCRPLSDSDRSAALAAMGCPAFGLREEVITVGPFRVGVSRRGLTMTGEAQAAPTELASCAQGIAGVRATTLEPPADIASGVKRRYFVEVFSWRPMREPEEGRFLFRLQGDAYEVLSTGIVPRAVMQDIPGFDRARWSRPGLPAGLDTRVTLQMIRTGHVRWEMDGTPSRGGWIMPAEDQAR
jgi:hypothetical protein